MTRANIVPIAVRMLQVSFSIVVTYYALRFFSNTTVTMVNQMAPMFVVLLAYFMLGERLALRQLLVLGLALVSVTFVILGGDNESD